MIEMTIVAFVAGMLTVLAPCTLPLIPVIVGGSGLHDDEAKSHLSLKRPLVIILSLVVSIVIFTLLLKSTTLLLGIPTELWLVISGGIIVLFGVNLLVPSLWEKFMIATGLQAKSNQLLAKSQAKNTPFKDILFGAALGPVFNSCSPTYALIVAVILPASFAAGMVYLLAYALGLGVILLLLAIFGRSLARKLGWLSAPNGAFQKAIGIILIIVGLMIIFGLDKKIQTFVLEKGWYDPIMRVEESLR